MLLLNVWSSRVVSRTHFVYALGSPLIRSSLHPVVIRVYTANNAYCSRVHPVYTQISARQLELCKNIVLDKKFFYRYFVVVVD